MKKIIVADTVREYAVMFAEKGEKATLKAWEKAEKTTDYVETVAVTLCLKALFARGDMTFIEAMFAEENVAKCFDSKYRHSFLPEGYRNLDSKQYQKWIEVELAENELASWWAFHNLPFLKDILDEVTDLFPAPYVHIGGDEALKLHWRHCPHCQKRIRQEGLKSEEELQRALVLQACCG